MPPALQNFERKENLHRNCQELHLLQEIKEEASRSDDGPSVSKPDNIITCLLPYISQSMGPSEEFRARVRESYEEHSGQTSPSLHDGLYLLCHEHREA